MSTLNLETATQLALSIEAAVAFVVDYFGGFNEPVRILDAALSHTVEGDYCDVGFDLDDGHGRSVFTVWYEHRSDGSPYLYGEY